MASSNFQSGAPDVLVIGGGIIGCSVALRLAQARLRVTVIERGEPGAEASRAAAGMLAPQGEMIEASEFFNLCVSSRDLYPSFIAEVEDLSSERVGYHRDGSLLVAISDEECRELEGIFQAQSKMGLPIERLPAESLRRRAPDLSDQIQFGLFLEGDHWVDNENLCRALEKSCRRLGVVFETRLEVKKLNVRNNRVESVEARSSDQSPHSPARTPTFSAGEFVLAAGCWSAALVAPLGISLPMEPCRGQVIEFECPTELPWVIRLGHHYLVPRRPGRVLTGTTSEYVGYDKAVTGAGLLSILEGATRLAPVVKDFHLCRAWAGLRPDTADHLPILGYGGFENLVFATGHFRNGILLAPLTAQLVAELLLTRSTSRAIDPYLPERFSRRKRVG